MRHFVIFFYLITLMTGVGSLAVAYFIYARTRFRLLLFFIAYQLSFTLFIFSSLFVLGYANLNLQQIDFTLLLSILSLTLLSFLSLMISIPLLVHALVLPGASRTRNVLVIVVSLIAFLAMLSTMKVDFAGKTINQVRDYRLYLSLTLFYSTIIYSILLKILALKRLDGERKTLARTLLILNIAFLPGVLYDLHLYTTYQVFAFTPILYCVLAVFYTFHFANRYRLQIRSMTTDTAGESFDTLFLRAGISKREQEIIHLVLQGLGNKDIAGRLFISPNTVKTHLHNVFRKMNVKTRFELVMTLRNSKSEQST